MLIASIDELARILAPVFQGEITCAAFDTETTEIRDGRYTPWGTDSRVAGFSISFDISAGPVDFYVPIRHSPYDWARERRLIFEDTKHRGSWWVNVLERSEGVIDTPGGEWREGWNPNLELGGVLDLLRLAFAAPGIRWLGHNWPVDAAMILADGIEAPWGRLVDTRMLSVFTDSRPLDVWNEREKRYEHGGHYLKHLGEIVLGREPLEKDLLEEAREVLGYGTKKYNDWSRLPLRTVISPYACQDTRLPLELETAMHARPWFDENVKALLEKHYREIQDVAYMMRRGVRVDIDGVRAGAEAKLQEIALHKQALYTAAGTPIPVESPKELAVKLYEELGFPTYRGNTDTREATLKQVRAKLLNGSEICRAFDSETAIEILDEILAHRSASTEHKLFYKPLTHYGEEGRVYPILNPLRAKTTRYSAEKPNIQQMKRVEKGKECESVRNLFLPADGHGFLCFDFATQELRIGGHFALAIPKAFEWRFTWPCTLAKRGDCKGRKPHGPRDDLDACKKVIHTGWHSQIDRRPARMGLVEGFLSGDRAFDPHQAMLDACQAEMLDWITRAVAKNVNFAIIYGAGIFKIAEMLDCTYEVARKIFDLFWEEAYPELGRVKRFIGERLRKTGPPSAWNRQECIRTLHGAPIFLADGFKGLNYVVQRSCREILLNAFDELRSYLAELKAPYRMIFPVHDEVVFEAPLDSIDRVPVRGIARIMVKAGSKSLIPMVVEPAIARETWAMKEALPLDWGYNGVNDA